MQNQRYVCTGPPGSGKTSVLKCLSADFTVISEPARRVLAAERASGGTGTGDQDPALFVSLMLQMTMDDAIQHADSAGPLLFDRGLPDLIAFAGHYGLVDTDIRCAVSAIRYADQVFWFPAWEEIYVNDDERTLDFKGAVAFGELIRAAYLASGYELIEMPAASISQRADFIRDVLT